ncbi:MAG: glycogen synthase [bacterium]
MKNKLKVFYVSPEVFPFARTGDLAEAAGALPKYLKNMGHDIRVMMPKYKTVNERRYVLRDVIRLQGVKIKLGNEMLQANGKSAFIPNSKVQIYFLDNKGLFDRDGLYCDAAGEPYLDNAKRFIFFAIGCLETLKLLHWQPDIIHCNDWQTALIPLLLKSIYKSDPFFSHSRTLLSVHSVRQQGIFDSSIVELTGVPQSFFNSNKHLVQDNSFNFLHTGFEYADLLNTVSDSFDAAVQRRQDEFLSIHHGIDGQIWNPATDKLIPSNYDLHELAGKVENRKQLLAKFGLTPSESAPVISMILDGGLQQESDFVLQAMEEIARLDVQMVVLGAVVDTHGEKLLSIKKKYPQKVGLQLTVDTKLAHLVEAGSDITLMPVLQEGAGLGQLCSLAYGTIPIVPRCSVRAEFVKEFNRSTRSGTGFIFDQAKADELITVVRKAIEYYADKEMWAKIMQNAMAADVSWHVPAQKYMKLYHKLVSQKNTRK